MNFDKEVRMTKVDLGRMDAEEPEEFSLQYSSNEEMTLGRLVVGALALIVSVAGAAYWAGGKSVRIEGEPKAPERVVQSEDGQRGNEPNNRQTVTLAAMPQVLVPRAKVEYLVPAKGATVEPTVLVRGVVSGVTNEHLWIVTQRAETDGVWPKAQISTDANGMFEHQIWDFGTDGMMSICVLATDSEVTARFDAWLTKGDRDDEWPALKLDSARSTSLGCQQVKLEKPEFL